MRRERNVGVKKWLMMSLLRGNAAKNRATHRRTRQISRTS